MTVWSLEIRWFQKLPKKCNSVPHSLPLFCLVLVRIRLSSFSQPDMPICYSPAVIQEYFARAQLPD